MAWGATTTTSVLVVASVICFLLGKSPKMAVSALSAATKGNMKKSFDLVVIGGGSAGLTAAKFAARFGKTVAIVESKRLGGDCTWTGCVPSKTMIASARAAHSISTASDFGIVNTVKPKVDLAAVRKRVQEAQKLIYDEDDSPEAMAKLGVNTIVGKAKFVSPKTLLVTNNGQEEEVEATGGVIICTGAAPVRPTNIPGLDSVTYLTYEEVWDLEELPERLTIVGGGPIGCELAQVFGRLGSTVTQIAGDCLLPRDEPEAGATLQKIFEHEGINVIQERVTNVASSGTNKHVVTCSKGTQVTGDVLLVAIGRKPTVTGMDLEKLGVELNAKGGIHVNAQLMTTVKGLYAAGDCTGDVQFTHYAGYQGAVAARNVLLPFSDPGVLTDVPATTFTHPEVASVGMSEAQARAELGDGAVSIAFKKLSEVDRAVCEGEKEGFIKIVYKTKGYQILGATVMSPVAGEMIAEICVAMKTKLSFDMLATVMHSYPAYSFALQAMAAELYYDKLVKNKRLYNFLTQIGL